MKRRGVDVVVALDVSKSMLARDVSPNRAGNRLKRAKMEVSGLIDRLQGDRPPYQFWQYYDGLRIYDRLPTGHCAADGSCPLAADLGG